MNSIYFSVPIIAFIPLIYFLFRYKEYRRVYVISYLLTFPLFVMYSFGAFVGIAMMLASSGGEPISIDIYLFSTAIALPPIINIVCLIATVVRLRNYETAEIITLIPLILALLVSIFFLII